MSNFNTNNGQSSDRSLAGANHANALTQKADAEQAVLGCAFQGYLEARKHAAESAKRNGGGVGLSVEQRLIDAKQMKESIYSDVEKATIGREGGTNVFKGLTGVKCRTAKAWILDIYSPKDGKIFGLEPTVIADLPGDELKEVADAAERMAEGLIKDLPSMTKPEQTQALQQLQVETARLKAMVMQEAQADALEKAKNLEKLVWDQLQEGGFRAALDTFIDNTVVFPAGFLKGPYLKRVETLKWEGKSAKVVATDVLCVEAPSPFDIFLSPGAKNVQDGYLFERMQLDRSDLYLMRDQPGFRTATIERLLGGQPDGVKAADQVSDYQREALERRPLSGVTAPGTFDVWEYWGYAPGALLQEWGISAKEAPDKLRDYAIRAWLVPGQGVLHCSVNPHPLGQRPYSAASCVSAPDTVWGKGIPDLVAHDQKLLNVLLRAMVNNTSLSAMPQAVIDRAMLMDGERVDNIWPGRIWSFDSSKQIIPGATTRPVDFFTVPSTVGMVMPLYQMTAKDIDEVSGIPAYAHGDSAVGGAGNTATGLSMLMNSASKVMRDTIRNLDEKGIIPLVQRFVWHNLLYAEDDTIKTDCQVMAIGSLSLFVKEQLQVSRQNFFSLVANPLVLDVIGVRGMAAILRELAEDLQLPSGNIVPSDEEIAAKEQGMQQLQALQGLQEQGIIPPEFNPQQPEQLVPASMVQQLFAELQQQGLPPAEPPPEYAQNQPGSGLE